jgi:hypothetical protein
MQAAVSASLISIHRLSAIQRALVSVAQTNYINSPVALSEKNVCFRLERLPCAPATNEQRSRVMQRRRFKHTLTFPERLDQEAERLRTEAEKLPHGQERDNLLREARQADTASHVHEWLSSPGLRAPE